MKAAGTSLESKAGNASAAAGTAGIPARRLRRRLLAPATAEITEVPAEKPWVPAGKAPTPPAGQVSAPPQRALPERLQHAAARTDPGLCALSFAPSQFQEKPKRPRPTCVCLPTQARVGFLSYPTLP